MCKAVPLGRQLGLPFIVIVIILQNVNVSYKKVTSTWFLDLLCLLFLKNNRPKTTLCHRGIFGDGKLCSPSSVTLQELPFSRGLSHVYLPGTY